MRYSLAQRTTVNAVHHGTVRCSTLRNNAAQQSKAKYNTVLYSTLQHSAVPHSTRRSGQYSAIQHSTLKHSTMQYTTVQRRQCSTLRYITIQYTPIQGSAVPYRRRTVDVPYSTIQIRLIALLGEVINRVFDALLNSSSNLVVEISWGVRAPEAAATGNILARNSPHGGIPGPKFPILHRPRERNILRTRVQNSPPDENHALPKFKGFHTCSRFLMHTFSLLCEI